MADDILTFLRLRQPDNPLTVRTLVVSTSSPSSLFTTQSKHPLNFIYTRFDHEILPNHCRSPRLLHFRSRCAAQIQRAADSVPSYLGRPATFYRAITRNLVATVATDYVVGQPPRTSTRDPGDFVPADKSGLHVFVNPREAQFYAECWAKISKAPTYVVSLAYTPSPNTRVKSFTTPNDEWRAFVRKTPHAFDIVEGPYSGSGGAGGMEQATPGGNMLWQGAFIGARGVSTLRVAQLTKIPVPGQADRRCCGLIPGCVIS